MILRQRFVITRVCNCFFVSHTALLGNNTKVTLVSGFAPDQWRWARANPAIEGGDATFTVKRLGVYTLSLHMREDGLLLERLLLHQEGGCLPTGGFSCLPLAYLPDLAHLFDPVLTESLRQAQRETFVLNRTIDYTYDKLYRLTEADYSTGEEYTYAYDPVVNRLQQIIDGQTTGYTYDAANRLTAVTRDQSSAVSYQYDSNGNRLSSDTLTNTWDAASRLTTAVSDQSLSVEYQ